MALELTDWNIQDDLTSPDRMLAYLEAVFEDGDPALITAAIQDVARAKGMETVSLDGKSDITAVIRTMKALGLELTAKAA